MNIEYGWKCPSCGAVMAPWQKACINCSGNSNSSPITMNGNRVVIEKPKIIDYEPAPWWANPNFHWDITCQQGTGTPINQSTITTAKSNFTTFTSAIDKLKNNLKSAGINT